MSNDLVNGSPTADELLVEVLTGDGHQYLSTDEKTELAAELAGLRKRLETLPVIEQAKGMLMAHYGISADVAFELLCRWSQTSNTKLRDIATALTQAAQHHPLQPGDSAVLHRTMSRPGFSGGSEVTRRR